MPANGPYLIALTLASILLLLVLILAVKLHAFLALILSSMALGLGAGMQPQAVLKSIQFGFGDALGFIAVVVPLVWSLARESKRSLLLYGLPMTCALTVTHALVPPHPAPAGAAQLLGA